MLAGLRTIYVDYFKKHGEASIPFLVNGKLSSFVLLSAYKKLTPVEQLTEVEKKELKEYTIGLFPEKNTEELMSAVKIIHAIGSLV